MQVRRQEISIETICVLDAETNANFCCLFSMHSMLISKWMHFVEKFCCLHLTHTIFDNSIFIHHRIFLPNENDSINDLQLTYLLLLPTQQAVTNGFADNDCFSSVISRSSGPRFAVGKNRYLFYDLSHLRLELRWFVDRFFLFERNWTVQRKIAGSWFHWF